MDLTVREAAALLGRSPRTLRAQLGRGEIPGFKRGRSWYVKREHLPLTERQRSALQAQADDVREAVEHRLPSRMATWWGDRKRRLADLDAFRTGAELYARLAAAGDAEQAAVSLHQALLEIAEADFVYERGMKLAAIDRARAAVGRAVATLLLEGPMPPGDPTHGHVLVLEDQMMPALSAFARSAARLPGRRRR
jgi:excisionase family DNA binding protein